jgi:hypothetical protein
MEPPEQHLGLAEAVFASSDAPSDATNYVQFQDRVPRSPPLRRDAGPDVYIPRPWKVSAPVESDAYSLWSAESIAIPLTYMYTGLLLSFPTAYMEYFPRQLGASDAQLSTISVVRALPWTFKVLFGVLPDNLPLRGQRFKPYLLLGCGISSFFHALLCISSGSLTVVSFTLLLLGAMVGIVMADVMSDALVAFRVLRKLEAIPGRTQSTVYMCRFLSEMVGYWAGALLSNRDRWGVGISMGQQFGFLAVFPLLTVVPSIWAMTEPSVSAVAPVRQQIDGLWHMLQRRATWQPVCFLVLANSCFVHNAAWGNYLKVAFHFDAFQYGAMAAVGASVTFASIYCYRELVVPHFSAPWHWVYLITGVMVAVFSTLNVLLVLGVNDALGVSPFWFAVGDDAVVSFARGFQYLPLAVMFVAVCPVNQEGVAFALLTSITNLAHAFANTVSNMLLHLWPVELADLEAGHFSGVWKLSVLTSIIPLLPLLLTTRLLPRGSQDHAAMMHETSRRWGMIVVCFYAFGFVWVLALSLLAVIQPCHFLVGGGGCVSPTNSASP